MSVSQNTTTMNRHPQQPVSSFISLILLLFARTALGMNYSAFAIAVIDYIVMSPNGCDKYFISTISKP